MLAAFGLKLSGVHDCCAFQSPLKPVPIPPSKPPIPMPKFTPFIPAPNPPFKNILCITMGSMPIPGIPCGALALCNCFSSWNKLTHHRKATKCAGSHPVLHGHHHLHLVEVTPHSHSWESSNSRWIESKASTKSRCLRDRLPGNRVAICVFLGTLSSIRLFLISIRFVCGFLARRNLLSSISIVRHL